MQGELTTEWLAVKRLITLLGLSALQDLALVVSVTSVIVGIFGFSLRSYSDTSAVREVHSDCTCDCWDGRMKTGFGRGNYKSIFINMDSGAFLILNAFLFYGLLAVATVKRIAQLAFSGSVSTPWALVGFAASMYSNFYGFFMIFNYVNDNFTHMFISQSFFSITELLSSACLLFLAGPTTDTSAKSLPPAAPDPLRLAALLIVFFVGSVHVVRSSLDQFVAHVFFGTGSVHQVIRDIGFFGPDIYNTVFAVCLLKSGYCRDNFYELLQARFFRKTLMIVLTVLVASALVPFFGV